MQTHLYRRGATYYWRRLVPTALQPVLGARDLGASLRTNIPDTARSRARQMDAAFDLALEEVERVVRSGQVLSDAVKSRFVRELRQEMIEKADDHRLMGDIRSPEQIEAAVAKALRLQKIAPELISRNDVQRGMAQADLLLAREGIQLDKSGIEYRRLARDILVGMVDAFGIIADQERGLPDKSDGFPPPTIIAGDEIDGIRTAEQIEQDRSNMRKPFSVHARAFKDEKVTTNRWGCDHCRDADAAYALFQELIGDKPMARYTPDEATDFVRLVTRLPVGVNQRHPFLAPPGQRMGAREANRLSPNTTAGEGCCCPQSDKRPALHSLTLIPLSQEHKI